MQSCTFDNIDTNKNGKLDENEIKAFLEKTHNDMPMEKIHDMIEKHDESVSASVQTEETRDQRVRRC